MYEAWYDIGNTSVNKRFNAYDDADAIHHAKKEVLDSVKHECNESGISGKVNLRCVRHTRDYNNPIYGEIYTEAKNYCP